MNGTVGKLHFTVMALAFRARDIFSPPAKRLAEAGLRPGDRVLDYGCGPGGFSLAAASKVGSSGRVYAADVNPLASRYVGRSAGKSGLDNIRTITTDRATGLEGESMDAALLYDTLHALEDADGVLDEICRVLKSGAVLSVNDHHMDEDDIVALVTGAKRFVHIRSARYSILFAKP